MQSAIDRSSPLPFYHQLKEIVRAHIEESNLRPGDRLPGDHELCERYQVSRTVVRQTLSELESEGVIERIKGRGTYVARPKVAQGLVQALTGLFEDVAAHGEHLHSQIRKFEIVPATAEVARDLAIPIGEAVIELERLRLVNEEPWVLTATHIPAVLAPGLIDEDMADQSLYSLLESKYGVELVRGRRSVEAAVATANLARSLGVERGAPILVLRSVILGPDDRPVETFVAYHRGDRSRFEVNLWRPTRGEVAAPSMVVTR